MPVVYPPELPAHTEWSVTTAERRAGEVMKPGSNVRARSRDHVQIARPSWIYTPDDMTIWVPWRRDTLNNGLRWFAMPAHGRGGRVDRVVRYLMQTMREDFLSSGIWKVSCDLEVRGLSEPPDVAAEPDEAVTWSPTYKGATIVLTGGNLIATDPSDSTETYATVRATVEIGATDKNYWEVEVLELDEVLDLFVGLTHTGAVWDVRFVAGGPRYAYRSTGTRYDGSIVDVYPPLEVGDVVGMAYDRAADKFWYRLNGVWLNTGDPETGTNPSSQGEVATEAMTPAIGFDNNVGHAAARGIFSAASWRDAAPAGFSALGV